MVRKTQLKERCNRRNAKRVEMVERVESDKRPKRRRNAAKVDGQIVFPMGPEVVVKLLVLCSAVLVWPPSNQPGEYPTFVPPFLARSTDG
jgi:hypothetical protein